MTPLANYFLNQATTVIKRRAPLQNPDGINIWRAMYGCRCFEISEVMPVVEELEAQTRGDGAAKAVDTVTSQAFLPAEKTWVEYAINGKREALHLEQVGEKDAQFSVFTAAACAKVAKLNLDRFLQYKGVQPMSAAEVQLVARVYVALAIINTPRIIRQVEHQPHKGVQRAVNAAKDNPPFKLLPWREIKLEVERDGMPSDVADDELKGVRALHFCRAHIRIKRGRIEYVRSHWRGDPALGIHQGRYTVQ